MAKAKRRSRTVPAVLPCWRPQARPRSLRPRSITSREQVHVVEADLRLKHRSDLTDAPRLLAVGDLHVENFRTWRDAEGRLVWGVNDFDEVAEMPYAVDLVRLVAALFSRNGRTDSPLTRRRSRLVNLPQSR